MYTYTLSLHDALPIWFWQRCGSTLVDALVQTAGVERKKWVLCSGLRSRQAFPDTLRARPLRPPGAPGHSSGPSDPSMGAWFPTPEPAKRRVRPSVMSVVGNWGGGEGKKAF